MSFVCSALESVAAAVDPLLHTIKDTLTLVHNNDQNRGNGLDARCNEELCSIVIHKSKDDPISVQQNYVTEKGSKRKNPTPRKIQSSKRNSDGYVVVTLFEDDECDVSNENNASKSKTQNLEFNTDYVVVNILEDNESDMLLSHSSSIKDGDDHDDVEFEFVPNGNGTEDHSKSFEIYEDTEPITDNSIAENKDDMLDFDIYQDLDEPVTSNIPLDRKDEGEQSAASFEVFQDLVESVSSASFKDHKTVGEQRAASFQIFQDSKDSVANVTFKAGKRDGSSLDAFKANKEAERLFTEVICLGQSFEDYSENSKLLKLGKAKVAEIQTKLLDISRDMNRDFQKLLVCWCPGNTISPDFIATVFGKYGDVDIRNYWRDESVSSAGDLFSGLIAEFYTESITLIAAKELAMRSSSIKMVQLNRLLQCFAVAEVFTPMYATESTSVVVSGKKLMLHQNDLEDFERLLHSLGNVVSLDFSDMEERVFGLICTVSYAYATQAYAAKFYLHGTHHEVAGPLSVVVKEKKKEKKILRKVKSKLIDFLDQAKFVHL